jgi:hypothetical protein
MLMLASEMLVEIRLLASDIRAKPLGTITLGAQPCAVHLPKQRHVLHCRLRGPFPVRNHWRGHLDRSLANVLLRFAPRRVVLSLSSDLLT